MIAVTVMYPNQAGSRFDLDYYVATHIPLVKERLGDAVNEVRILKGLAGGGPDQPATYQVIGQLICSSLEAFQSGMAKHGQEILGDIPNFTDTQPTLQISDVVG